jgi:hypothetical protein
MRMARLGVSSYERGCRGARGRSVHARYVTVLLGRARERGRMRGSPAYLVTAALHACDLDLGETRSYATTGGFI